MTPSTDRIEKKIELRAPLAKVWHALTDAKAFGSWFGVKLDSGFAPGARVQGQITHPGFEHMTMHIAVDKMEPQHLFSYHWHPYAVDPKTDYSSEKPTLVEFHLTEQEGNTLLTVIESGFDQVPPARRAEAYRMNDKGWAAQLRNIERHVTTA